MTVVATVVITRVARQALNEAVAEDPSSPENGLKEAGAQLNGHTVGA